MKEMTTGIPTSLTSLAMMLALLFEMFHRCWTIHCFECYSVDGSNKDCEDDFGPYNQTGYLLHRRCEVGYLGFEAFYCVKIKGTRYDGQTIVIRTCSVDDWGSQCGDIFFEQNDVIDRLSGCLASCNFDGCNHAPSAIFDLRVASSIAAILSAILSASAIHDALL